MRNLFMASASASVLLGLAGAAEAQDQATATAALGNQLQEVVVTAQRRSENVQKSNLAISVLSGDELRRNGVADPKDLNNSVPGLTIAQRGSNTQVYVRGIGDNSATGLAVPAVAVNMDGVYIDRPTAVAPNFYDLDRIEVLKGPQGTLYGRNASGGAVNLISAKPTQSPGGYVDVEAGNYSLFGATGAVNMPVNDQLALRAAFQVINRNGYLSDGYNDQKSQAGRLQALWKPNENISLRLSADLAHIGGMGAGTVILQRPAGFDPWQGSSTPAAQAIVKSASTALLGPALGAATAPPQGDGYMRNNTANISAELNWKMNWATLTVIPAFRHMDLDYVTYEPGYYSHDTERSDQTTLEMRLSNQTDRLKWTVGGYGFDERQVLAQSNDANALIFENVNPVPKYNTQAYAAFGEATLSLTSAFRVLGGLRYTHETKDISGATVNSFGLAPGQYPAPFPVGTPFAGSLTNTATNYKAGVEYDLTERSMLYATTSTGFKAGGFYFGSVPNSYQPETLTSYEVGSRNRFFDNRLQVNLEGFYWKYDNLQQSRQGYGSNGALTFITVNAGAASLYGADLDVKFKATSADTFGATVEYNHSRYNNFAFDAPTGRAISGVTTGCPVGAAHLNARGLSVQTINCAGYQLQRAPELTSAINYQHIFDLATSGKFTFDVSGAYTSSRYLSLDFISFMKARDNFTEDMSLTYAPPHGSWTLSAWVKNLSNEAVYTAAVQYSFARNLAFGNVNPPRTFGGRLHFAF